MKQVRHSKAQRLKFAQIYLEGDISQADLLEQRSIRQSTLEGWIQEYRREHAQDVPSGEFASIALEHVEGGLFFSVQDVEFRFEQLPEPHYVAQLIRAMKG